MNNFAKKLLYLSNYRGCKEADIIIGNFAKEFIDKFNDDELILYEQMLSLQDPDILDYLMNRSDKLAQINNPLLKKLKEYSNSQESGIVFSRERTDE